jgi:hypothetical protein
VKDTPRSFSPQPTMSLSGSAHSRSHSKPVSGMSDGGVVWTCGGAGGDVMFAVRETEVVGMKERADAETAPRAPHDGKG